MPRQPAQVREAVPEDAEALLTLWGEVARDDGTVRAVQDAARALGHVASDPDQRMLVVECDDRIVAAVQLTRAPVSPLSSDTAVHTSYLLVAPAYRKHGYAHALMEAAVEWAEEKDIPQVLALTDTNRDTNRFFARLGLSTVATVRAAPTAVLRKRLASAARATGVNGGNRHLVEVLAKRRSMRRRQGSDPVSG